MFVFLDEVMRMGWWDVESWSWAASDGDADADASRCVLKFVDIECGDVDEYFKLFVMIDSDGIIIMVCVMSGFMCFADVFEKIGDGDDSDVDVDGFDDCFLFVLVFVLNVCVLVMLSVKLLSYFDGDFDSELMFEDEFASTFVERYARFDFDVYVV